MRTLCVALAALALSQPAAAYHGHAALTWTTQGPALRTTRAAASGWAQRPSAYTLGAYHNASSSPGHGASALRTTHAARLRTCNPFAHVSATQPLAPC